MKSLQFSIASLVLAMAAPGVATAQSPVNPAYQMWAAWSEGATVTLKLEHTADGKTETTGEHRQTVKSTSAEKVVVEFVMTVKSEGMTFQTPPLNMDVLAKLPTFVLPKELTTAVKAPPTPVSKSKETKGRETLTINGRKLDCEWLQIDDEDGRMTKMWFSDDVPGRTVKAVSRTKDSTDTSVVVDWKGAKKK